MVTIEVAKDFSAYPGGRYLDDGPYNGERFREELLLPALGRSDVVTVLLDGTKGYPSSFLEESFGGLVRKGYSAGDLRRRLKVVAQSSEYSRYVTAIWHYIDEANEPSVVRG